MNSDSKIIRFAVAIVIALLVGYLIYLFYVWVNKTFGPPVASQYILTEPENDLELDEKYLDLNYQEVTVYFVNTENFKDGIEPYEEPVKRLMVASIDPKVAVIEAYYSTPTSDEVARGLQAIYSGTTNAVVSFDQNTGIARVDLMGACNAGGAAYNLASLINKNLKQFDDVKYVRIYDQNGNTLSREGVLEDSTPECLQP